MNFTYIAWFLVLVLWYLLNIEFIITNLKNPTMKAIWNNQIIAESDETVVLEGNHYFPYDSIKLNFFRDSDTHTTCSWKGVASYKTIIVEDKINKDAAWFYPEPKTAAAEIKNYIAFWKGVKIEA